MKDIFRFTNRLHCHLVVFFCAFVLASFVCVCIYMCTCCMYIYDMNMYHIHITSYVYDVDKQNVRNIRSDRMKRSFWS